ncbi:KAP family P-loop NTPase fold protein [Actinocatenispora sera]|uniref:KAP NTPase domain-containing protein n=1 Tax=Actinocatenispora sera TaxID=390989 RepID=A0A810KXM2_9ACTN|nr:P-loop NTPase fold protein [Actinocatenispora sera]BCJ27943.1 hypothetical protein Asera_20510 [Actinocatenispora sera]
MREPRSSPPVERDTNKPAADHPKLNEDGLYGDDPLSELMDDDLDRQRLVDSLARTLGSITRQSESAVAAIVGPWGSGKTTLLNSLRQHLANDNKWHLASFNPWMYNSYESAANGFFSELSHAIPEDLRRGDTRGSIGKLAARLAPYGSLGGLIGVDVSRALEATATLISGDQSPEAAKARAEGELRELDKPILVILDDLDRLEPAELLHTFRLVRLAGRLPNVYYLLSYDEETIEDVLGRTDLASNNPGRARDYLEKIVQIRIDIPPLLESQKLGLFNRLLDQLIARHSIDFRQDISHRLSRMWIKTVEPYMIQPRAIKRLFTQLDASWVGVADEVDFVDFMGIVFLKTFERSAFDLVLRLRSELLGETFSYEHQKETNSDRWTRWINNIGRTHPRHPESIQNLLADLFPYLRAARDNITFGYSHAEDTIDRRGVASRQFFDRYTQMTVPAQDLPDSVIRSAAVEMANMREGTAIQAVTDALQTDAGLVGLRLERFCRRGELSPVPWIEWIGHNYIEIKSQHPESFVRPDSWFRSMAIELLDKLEVEAAVDTLKAIGATNSGLILATEIVRFVTTREPSDSFHGWTDAAIPVVSNLAEQKLRMESTHSIKLEDARLVDLCSMLGATNSPSYIQEILWDIFEKSTWNLEDFLGLMVGTATVSSGQETWKMLGSFELSSVDNLLGLQRVRDTLNLSPNTPAIRDAEVRTVDPPTLEERISYAQSILADPNASNAQAEP